MCDCKERVEKEFAEKYWRHGKNALVGVDCSIDVQVSPFTYRKPHKYYSLEEKQLLATKHSRHYGIDMRYCPMCGEKFDKPRGAW